MLERLLVRRGGFIESAHLADELKRSRADFLGCHRRIEMVERPDIPAHDLLLLRW
jgi:hypothetical protein